MSKKLNINWYSLDNILKHDAQYYMIFVLRKKKRQN